MPCRPQWYQCGFDVAIDWAVTERTKQKLKTYGRRTYFGALFVAAAFVTWNATVGAGRRAPAFQRGTAGGHELSCEIPGAADRKPKLLGQLPEASGLAASRRSPGLLWSMNDSGASTVVAVSTTGDVRGRVGVAGAKTEDWEDISVGSCPGGSCLYVADIGEAGAKRKQMTVYRVPEPQPGDTMTGPADTFVLTYPDKPHDAEAAFVLPDQTLYMITKGHPTILYRASLNAPGSSTAFTKVAELPIDQFLADKDRRRSRITDAELTPNGLWVAIRTNSELLLLRTRDMTAGKMNEVWHGDLRLFDESQGEGVAVSDDGDVYLAGEGGGRGLPGTLTHIKCQLPKT